MRYFASVVLCLYAVFLPPPVAAQALPPGSYADSCRNMAFSNDVLTAQCKTKNGNWRGTALHKVSLCQSNVRNDDGNLRCTFPDIAAAGSFRDSCIDPHATNSQLYATCRRKDGSYSAASLIHWKACTTGIENDDGRLVCTFPGSKPAGTYQTSCDNIWAPIVNDRHWLRATCRKQNGSYVYAETVLGDCRAAVRNMDGVLDCRRQTATFPPGSYQKTCRNIRSGVTQIKADCQRRSRGAWAATVLDDWPGCVGDISNQSGRLTCMRVSVSMPSNPGGSIVRPNRVICKGDSIPAGFIATNDATQDLEGCASGLYNVWIVSDYENLGENKTLDICANFDPPSGWEEVETIKDPTKCKGFLDVYEDADFNQRRIRRE
ncbi:CVNH domain-containing protein [Pseudooceanicola sp. C21-150M6]|uniref:CVNH domain-containing protein n=1 Tax=Pseudooceanicola sp. C21-150M6 TaxID=3434355 RepID=UPI003D7FEAF9